MSFEVNNNIYILGNKENATNIQVPVNEFKPNISPKNCSASIKNQRQHNCCQHITTTTSLDAFNFPVDTKNLERVNTSPNLITSDINYQKYNISIDMDSTRRERIDRYKEERRLALRERFKISESVPYDDEIVKRLKVKSLKSPDECTEKNMNISIKPSKRLVKIIPYDEREKIPADSEKKWHTHSLEREVNAKKETKSLIASRVNQLLCSTTSGVISDQNTLKPSSKYAILTNN